MNEKQQKAFSELMAKLEEEEQDEPAKERLKEEIIEFLNKHIMKNGFCSK